MKAVLDGELRGVYEDRRTTVASFLRQWLAAKKEELAPNTYAGYETWKADRAWKSPASVWTSTSAHAWRPATCSPPGTAPCATSADRRTGWRPRHGAPAGERPLEEAGAAVPEPLRGDWTPLSGYRVGQELAGRVAAATAQHGTEAPTAVFVTNDQMAPGPSRERKPFRLASGPSETPWTARGPAC